MVAASVSEPQGGLSAAKPTAVYGNDGFRFQLNPSYARSIMTMI